MTLKVVNSVHATGAPGVGGARLEAMAPWGEKLAPCFLTANIFSVTYDPLRDTWPESPTA